MVTVAELQALRQARLDLLTGSEAVRRSEWLQSLNCRRCVRRALIY